MKTWNCQNHKVSWVCGGNKYTVQTHFERWQSAIVGAAAAALSYLHLSLIISVRFIHLTAANSQPLSRQSAAVPTTRRQQQGVGS